MRLYRLYWKDCIRGFIHEFLRGVSGCAIEPYTKTYSLNNFSLSLSLFFESKGWLSSAALSLKNLPWTSPRVNPNLCRT